MKEHNTFRLFDTNVTVCTQEGAKSIFAQYLDSKNFHHVITPNTEMIMLARRSKAFRDLLNQADLAIPDGIGLVWAARLLYNKHTERVTGSDMIKPIVELAAERDLPVLFINKRGGFDSERATKAAKILQRDYPSLKVTALSLDAIESLPQSAINTHPSVVLVGLGAPDQDFWIEEHCRKIPSVRLAMGVGGAFDFITGIQKRAPKSWQKLGLEWLWRLVHQPKRIKRQLVIPYFMLLVMLIKLHVIKNSALRA